MSRFANGEPGMPRGRGLDPVLLLYRLAAGHATCLTVFVRRRFGTEAFRVDGLVAFACIVGYGGMTGAYAMWPFLWVWLVMLVVRRVESHAERWRGRDGHSRYGGWPWLALRVWPWARGEQAAKTSVEPPLCLVGGLALTSLSPPLGVFVALGCFSLMVKTGIERWAFDARARAMRDAAIENGLLADAFNGGRDGR